MLPSVLINLTREFNFCRGLNANLARRVAMVLVHIYDTHYSIEMKKIATKVPMLNTLVKVKLARKSASLYTKHSVMMCSIFLSLAAGSRLRSCGKTMLRRTGTDVIKYASLNLVNLFVSA